MFKMFFVAGAVAVTAVVAGGSEVRAQAFQLVDASPIGMSLAELGTIQRTGDRVRIDVHLVYRSPLSFEDTAGQFDVVQRGVMSQVHDCRTGQFQMTAIQFVTFDGKASGEPSRSGEWEKINDGSPADKVHGLLCRNEPATDVEFESLGAATHVYYGVVNDENAEE